MADISVYSYLHNCVISVPNEVTSGNNVGLKARIQHRYTYVIVKTLSSIACCMSVWPSWK